MLRAQFLLDALILRAAPHSITIPPSGWIQFVGLLMQKRPMLLVGFHKRDERLDEQLQPPYASTPHF